MYLSCCEDEESLVMFNGCVWSYALGLRRGGWVNHTLSLGIERKYSLVKRCFVLVQQHDHDPDVLRYHGRPNSS